MKISTNKFTSLPVYKLDDTDAAGIMHLRQLIGGKLVCGKCGTESENRAWDYLQGYFSSLRLWIEELGKAHAQSRAKKEICSNDFSILTGVDLAVRLPKQVVAQWDMTDKIQKEKEAQNAGPIDQDD